MTIETTANVLSRTLKPVCPRDNHEMQYEAKAGALHDEKGGLRVLPSYYCGHYGCSVRYLPAEGYFTVVDTPDSPHVVEEPGANVLQCPRHGTWLYRLRADNPSEGFRWRCGVEGCDYIHEDVDGFWFRPSEVV